MDDFDSDLYFQHKEAILIALRDLEARLTNGSTEFQQAWENALEDFYCND